MDNAVTDPLTGSQMEYEDIIKDPKLQETWTTSISNELGRLSEGLGDRIPSVLNTVSFISKDKYPKRKFTMYARIVCKICPQKAEIHRTRLTLGGNLIKYPHNICIPTSDF